MKQAYACLLTCRARRQYLCASSWRCTSSHVQCKAACFRWQDKSSVRYIGDEVNTDIAGQALLSASRFPWILTTGSSTAAQWPLGAPACDYGCCPAQSLPCRAYPFKYCKVPLSHQCPAVAVGVPELYESSLKARLCDLTKEGLTFAAQIQSGGVLKRLYQSERVEKRGEPGYSDYCNISRPEDMQLTLLQQLQSQQCV